MIRLLTLVLSIIHIISHAQTPGVSTYYQQYTGDNRQYLEYIPGNLPIIISAPHGGVKQSGTTVGGVFYPDNDSSLPDRNCGSNERDDNTDILVREIQANIHTLTGCYAHVIITNLHRSKMDPNREVNEATCGDSDAIDHWNAYHNFIDQASTAVEANWGKGLFLDVHGQSHTIPRIEVGYNVTAGELNNDDLNDSDIVNKSTIKNLVTTNIGNLSHESLIRGNTSLGQLFHDAPGTYYASQNYPGCSHNGTAGYRAVPSNTDTGSSSCDDTKPFSFPYFDGDFYNNRRHGSGNGVNDGNGNSVGGGGAIDGIMTEVNRRVRDLGTYNGTFYDSRPPTLIPFAVDYAGVVLDYLENHYDDFTHFDFDGCEYSINGVDPTPTISGVSVGTFTSNPPLTIDANTGTIDLSAAAPGTYSIKYEAGTCGYYNTTRTVVIKSGTVGYVDTNASGTGDGLSWENAYTSLETALADNCKKDTLKVAEGTYIPNTSNRNYAYDLYNNLTIIGGYAIAGIAYDPDLYKVYLSGNIGNINSETDNLYHCFNVSNNVENLTLQNLTFTEGYANGSNNKGLGSAIFNRVNSSISLINIDITNNKSLEGEAILNKGTFIIVEKLTFSGNEKI